MRTERAIIWLLLAISLVIVVPGAWISGEQLLEARTYARWSTETGCSVWNSVVNWCNPERRAEAAEMAAMHRHAALHYARLSLVLIVALWGMFYAVRWVVQGFQGPKPRRR